MCNGKRGSLGFTSQTVTTSGTRAPHGSRLWRVYINEHRPRPLIIGCPLHVNTIDQRLCEYHNKSWVVLVVISVKYCSGVFVSILCLSLLPHSLPFLNLLPSSLYSYLPPSLTPSFPPSLSPSHRAPQWLQTLLLRFVS